MELGGLLAAIRRTGEYQRVLQTLRGSRQAETSSTLTWELAAAARPAVLAALQKDWGGAVLVLSARPEQARILHEQVSLWSGHKDVPTSATSARPLWYFPAPDALFYDWTPWDGETVRRRVAVLSELADHDDEWKPTIFASIWSLMTLTAPPAILRAGIRQIQVGDRLPPRKLLEDLVSNAYEPNSVVEDPGTFSQRGGILDVWSPQAPQPLRVEWLGDTVETIRAFDPVTQVSSGKCDALTLYPGSEALPRFGLRAQECLLPDTHAGQSLGTTRPQQDRERLGEGVYFRGMEFYLACLYPQAATLLDYLPDNMLVVVDDLPAVDAAARTLESQSIDLRVELLEQGRITPAFPTPYVPWSNLGQALRSLPSIVLGYELETSELETEAEQVAQSPGAPSFQPAPRYAGRVQRLVSDCMSRSANGQRTVVVSRQVQRLSRWFEESGAHIVPTESVPEVPQEGSVTLVHGALGEGWRLQLSTPKSLTASAPPPLDVLLLTDTEVFGWAKPRRRPFTRKKAASPESFFAELQAGDYVVHIDYGIGVYHGLVQRSIEGAEREYLELEYAQGDRLYLPVSQIDRVTRYVGSSDHAPTIHRLGSSDWTQVRARAKSAVQDIAKDLLRLYAARQVVTGYAFSPDTAWQEDLEASFPYDETADQLQAAAEVKQDMEDTRPMDRLLVGDVGYGKTEIAVRAAFKAAMDGKQAAVLVPTTVLAQQHLITFQQRLAAFPIEVAMLSRFCSAQEQADVAQGLVDGKVDIVIGTHRLLQKDVSFKDLGLLIVDEEQRFGVRHKEWLKQMRQQIDVLTLTATPIPRTLYMSLSGARDMSTMDTPPEERLPVRTLASRFDEALIRRAILREMDRGGQVYFVHNRVRGIRQMAQRLTRIVPEANIAIGHGQMEENELSKVMLDFAGGQHDVLVCTSIIESGLDIPNVNTIIINRADQFGLAQLYQLRGRVGRSTAQAYAYLLYDQRDLTDVARRRLEAILEASELGAGFRIAMRDLEIRGAGEVLGARQHGHIAAVGFELYCRLLAQAVEALKASGPDSFAKVPEIEPPPLVDLPVQAYLPHDFVPDESLRLRLYQRLASLDKESDLHDVRKELEDRFGLLPPPVEDLLYVLQIRLLAMRAGVQAIAREDGNLVLRLRAKAQARARHIATHFGRQAWVGRGQMWLALKEVTSDWRTLLTSLLVRLQDPESESSAKGQP